MIHLKFRYTDLFLICALLNLSKHLIHPFIHQRQLQPKLFASHPYLIATTSTFIGIYSGLLDRISTSRWVPRLLVCVLTCGTDVCARVTMHRLSVSQAAATQVGTNNLINFAIAKLTLAITSNCFAIPNLHSNLGS